MLFPQEYLKPNWKVRSEIDNKIMNLPKEISGFLLAELVDYERNTTFNKREILSRLIGSKCSVCGSGTRRILFHEKSGKRHSLKLDYYLDNWFDFEPLCTICHGTVHTKEPLNLERLRQLRKKLGRD